MTLGFPHTVRHDLKNEELKRRLIECVNEQNDKFMSVAEGFNELDRREELHYLELCDAIIAAVDHVLAGGDWDDSLFLRNTIKPLKKIRDHAVELRQSFDTVNGVKKMVPPEAGENCVKLYVSLYQANGHDMKKWADQLSSLGRYMIGRPIYQKEHHVVQAVRKKLSQTSEAYVVAAVDQSKIISAEHSKLRTDKLGNELVTLAPDAISASNILEFVHQSKRYCYCDHRLVVME